MKPLQGLVGMAAVVLLALGVACQYQQKPAPAPPDTRAAEESAIRARSVDWFKAIAAKDLEKSLSFYATDAAAYPPNQPIAATSDQRRKVWRDTFNLPGFAIAGMPAKVEAARSGDMAYETGSFELTVNDKKGKPAASKGKYVVVWKKQADGVWKAVADIWNTDQ